MSQLHERIQFFSTRNPTQKDFQEMVNGAKRLEEQLKEAKKAKFLQKKRFQKWIKRYLEGCGAIGRTDLSEMYEQLKEQGDVE